MPCGSSLFQAAAGRCFNTLPSPSSDAGKKLGRERMTMLKQTATRCVLFLACAVLHLPISLAQDIQGVKSTSGFVTTSDGVKIHYLESGPQAAAEESPAILFVPGWTMWADIWESQLAYFSKTRRVVAMDPRSQGLSSQTTEGHYPAARARDIKAVVDHLKLAPAVLVGWSMAVTELVAYVDQFGCDTVVGLVLVDNDAGSGLDPGSVRPFFQLFEQLQKDRPAATRNFLRTIFFKRPHSEGYFDRVTRASLRTPTDTAITLLVGMLWTDLRRALAKITRPTLIVAAKSPYVSSVEDMQKHVAGSRLEVFENAGHALFVDEPDRFNALVESFLKTLEPQRVPQGGLATR
jgi:microsomal epoxide hydrolase